MRNVMGATLCELTEISACGVMASFFLSCDGGDDCTKHGQHLHPDLRSLRLVWKRVRQDILQPRPA